MPDRPRRVIVVDADNPMVEVDGEFFWREDHDLLLAAARDEAYKAGAQVGYQEGYRVGWANATHATGNQQHGVRRQVIELRKHHSILGGLVHGFVNLVVLWCVLMFLAFLAERFAG
jgi:hypothetical protein